MVIAVDMDLKYMYTTTTLHNNNNNNNYYNNSNIQLIKTQLQAMM